MSLSAHSQEKRGPLHVAERRRERSGEERLLPGSSAEVHRMSHPEARRVRSLHQQVVQKYRDTFMSLSHGCSGADGLCWVCDGYLQSHLLPKTESISRGQTGLRLGSAAGAGQQEGLLPTGPGSQGFTGAFRPLKQQPLLFNWLYCDMASGFGTGLPVGQQRPPGSPPAGPQRPGGRTGTGDSDVFIETKPDGRRRQKQPLSQIL